MSRQIGTFIQHNDSLVCGAKKKQPKTRDTLRENGSKMRDLREQLAAALPEHAHKLVFYSNGHKHPPYNTLSVADALRRFCADLLPRSPIVDPRGKRISIVKTNFPKLAGLQHRKYSREDFPASAIIAAIEDGGFDLADYEPARDDRLRTLFWIPETLSDPDVIYTNGHKIVAGDEVYARVYDKTGSTVKVIFTMDIRKERRTSTNRSHHIVSDEPKRCRILCDG